jgi:hypothetical protein
MRSNQSTVVTIENLNIETAATFGFWIYLLSKLYQQPPTTDDPPTRLSSFCVSFFLIEDFLLIITIKEKLNNNGVSMLNYLFVFPSST